MTRFGEPFTIARTRWMFGFQRRFVRRWEWLNFMPKIGFLPHTSHTDDIAAHPRGWTEKPDGAGEENRVRLAPGPERSDSGRVPGRRLVPMPTLTSLGPADLRQALLRFRDAVRAHQEELNRLNVYPVPDGDTGTNMALTLESVSAALAQSDSMDEVCHAISRGSLMGARGNSGVILSQILRGDRRGVPSARGRARLRSRARLPQRGRRRLPGRHAPGRGHDPHRRP